MAEQPRMAAPFPAPPPFYKHFTKHNATQLRQLRKEAGIPSHHDQDATINTSPEPRDLDTLSLPAELRYLLPPVPPTNHQFKAFGILHDLNAPTPALADPALQIEQLYPSHPSVRLNPQSHLISLARSQLTTYLALVGAMSQDAEQWPLYTGDLETITFNMHDLINQYRPHQARETLILGMEERVAQMRGEIGRIGEARGKVQQLLEGLETAGGGLGGVEGGVGGMVGEGGVEDVAEKKRRARQRAAWAALEEDMGRHAD
ncbi:hypothetical protein LTR36_006558 [Oleoguttula mirabilis]|uniref:Mediator of RNA polymerase II transcription subunit 7 n=1 Tax=Oleoguttula mirabilis TaxID=1507867 RepID=A0AAV9JWZ9_9PEZI|nr:hypothetical protein LTR36_006558 [Oleoguttula mirabilis]